MVMTAHRNRTKGRDRRLVGAFVVAGGTLAFRSRTWLPVAITSSLG